MLVGWLLAASAGVGVNARAIGACGAENTAGAGGTPPQPVSRQSAISAAIVKLCVRGIEVSWTDWDASSLLLYGVMHMCVTDFELLAALTPSPSSRRRGDTLPRIRRECQGGPNLPLPGMGEGCTAVEG